jgi:hypothetical protein
MDCSSINFDKFMEINLVEQRGGKLYSLSSRDPGKTHPVLRRN